MIVCPPSHLFQGGREAVCKCEDACEVEGVKGGALCQK